MSFNRSTLAKNEYVDIAGHYTVALNKNHYVGPYCRIYLCKGHNTDGKGYCLEHTSALRSGLTPGLAGSAPIVKKSPVNPIKAV